MKLVPPLFYIDPQSNAEAKVARLLDQMTSDPEAVGYHSVHLPEHQYKMMAEADFVILWKGAVLVLEVKGGNLRREDGVWAFRDRYGTDHFKAEGPWQQAQTAMFALRKRLEAKVDGPRRPFASLVITPDQNLPSDLEWAPWEYAGHSDMSVARLENKLDVAAKRARDQMGHSTPQPLNFFRRSLRGDFDRVPRLSEETSLIDSRMVSLLQEQSDLLEAFDENDRVMVKGGAGTGKTLLAAAAAVRASLDGRTVLFTCRSEALLESVAATIADSSVVCAEFDHLSGLGTFDLVVVDEAHDLMNIFDLAVLESVVRGGFDSGSWWMFIDPNNQAHVDGLFDVDLLVDLQRKSAQFTLRTNCRNTEPIVTQVQSLLGADLGVPKVGAGPKVILERARSIDQVPVLIDKHLARLVEEQVSTKDIAIVTILEDSEKSSVWRTKAYAPGKSSPRIYTARQIKGLEARHVLVVDVEDLDTDLARARLYVGMTRARISLWMVVGDPAWSQMAQMATAQVREKRDE